MAESYEQLKLGDTIYEALPWDGKVVRRCVVRIDTCEEWDTLFERPKETVRMMFASGGMFGRGERINDSSWGSKYFPDEESARKTCVEQSVILKREHREQVQSEIDELQKQLNDQSAEVSGRSGE